MDTIEEVKEFTEEEEIKINTCINGPSSSLSTNLLAPRPNLIQFQGLTFDLKSSCTQPISCLSDEILNKQSLTDFLEKLHFHNFLDKENKDGLILYADD